MSVAHRLARFAAALAAAAGVLHAQDWRLVDAVMPRNGGVFDSVRNRVRDEW